MKGAINNLLAFDLKTLIGAAAGAGVCYLAAKKFVSKKQTVALAGAAAGLLAGAVVANQLKTTGIKVSGPATPAAPAANA